MSLWSSPQNADLRKKKWRITESFHRKHSSDQTNAKRLTRQTLLLSLSRDLFLLFPLKFLLLYLSFPLPGRQFAWILLTCISCLSICWSSLSLMDKCPTLLLHVIMQYSVDNVMFSDNYLSHDDLDLLILYLLIFTLVAPSMCLMIACVLIDQFLTTYCSIYYLCS